MPRKNAAKEYLSAPECTEHLHPFLTWITERHAACGGITEIRILGQEPFKGTWTTYLKPSDVESFLQQAAPVQSPKREKLPYGDYPRIGEANYYFTKNPVQNNADDFYSRAPGRIIKAKHTTGDDDIIGYSLVGIDVDPIRTSGVCATEEEKHHARMVLLAMKEWFKNQGIYGHVGDSGNGYHYLIPVPLQEDKETFSGYYQTLLAQLQQLFGNEHAEIDANIYNPSRIFKLYGSLAMKGHSTELRPYRWSRIKMQDIEDQDLVGTITPFIEEKLDPPKETSSSNGNGSNGKTEEPKVRKRFKKSDVPDWDSYSRDEWIRILKGLIEKNGLQYDEMDKRGNHLLRFYECPYHPGNKDDKYECSISVSDDKRLGGHCAHDPKAGWKQFKEVLNWKLHALPVIEDLGLRKKAPEKKNAVAVESLSDLEALRKDIEAFNKAHAVVDVGGKCVVAHTRMDNTQTPPREEIVLYTRESLRMRYANRKYWITNPDGKVRCKILSEAWLESPKRREFQKLEFRPGVAQEDSPNFNLWRGWNIEPKEGDCSLFKDHLLNVICGNAPDKATQKMWRAWLWMWMADAVQNPADRPGTSIVIIGKQGTGKSAFVEMFGRLFGQHYLEVSQSAQFLGKHNQHLQDVQLLYADEAFWAGSKQDHGAIKHLVTGKQMFIEPKGLDGYKVDNHIRLIITSNEEWVVPAGVDSRRFFVIECSNARANDTEYFNALYHQMENGGYEALMHELLEFKGIQKDELRFAPETDMLLEQKKYSFAREEWWWFEILMRGCIHPGNSKFESVISKESMYHHYADFMDRTARNERRSVEVQLGKNLRKWVAGIGECRTLRPPLSDKRFWSSYDRDPEDITQENQVRCWKLLSLEECRRSFEEYLNHEIEWEEEDKNQSNTSSEGEGDEPF